MALVGISEAARLARVSTTTINKWAATGDLKVELTCWGYRQFSAEAVMAFAAGRREAERQIAAIRRTPPHELGRKREPAPAARAYAEVGV